MNSVDIVQQRAINQQLTGTKFTSAQEIVTWMGAMQAQDYAMVKWAIGIRLPGSTDAMVEEVINAGEIIRTHVMRPTWHLVSPKDVRWMLALTAPHLHKAMKSTRKNLGLTEQILKRSNSIIEKSLIRNGYMTRKELVVELHRNKINPNNLQAIHILFNAELRGTVCNGPMRGKQFTYALFEQRVPQATLLAKDDALAELSKRYFTSHGPATLQDFTWWSGLPALEAKISLESVKSCLVNQQINGQVFWSTDSVVSEPATKSIYFLPSFDEFMVSYKDRSASLTPKFLEHVDFGHGIFKPIIVVNGKVIGIWSREIKKDRIMFKTRFLKSVEKLKKKECNMAFEAYKKFHNKK